MSESYPTTLERRKASSLARGLAVDAAKALRVDAQRAIDETVRGLGKLRECGVSLSYLDDTTSGLLDEVSKLTAAIATTLDGVGFWSDELVDTSEIHALLAKVRG